MKIVCFKKERQMLFEILESRASGGIAPEPAQDIITISSLLAGPVFFELVLYEREKFEIAQKS